MKYLNRGKTLRKSFFYFLVFSYFNLGFFSHQNSDTSQEVSLLNKEAQELICSSHTSSPQAKSICLEDKVSVERVAVCKLYTTTYLAEALCLKNKDLSHKKVFMCFIDTNHLIEQICLVGSETSSRVITNFKATDGDSSAIITEIENITTEMESLLSEYKVRFDITEGVFDFYN